MPRGLLARLGVRHPIFLAPMGGGPGTPALCAAVSNAGGLGALGSAYQTPQQLRDSVAQVRALTDRPFSVNLFAGGWDAHASGDATAMLELLAPLHARLGIPPPAVPQVPPDPFPAQLEAVLEVKPAAFTFTFGVPAASQLQALKSRGIVVLGTATTAHEARLLADAGVDGVIVQGAEAGAHRGTFAHAFEEALVPLHALIEQVTAAVPLPVVAAGGLMDGADVAAVLRRGADAAMLGTAFLTCPESGASEAYRQALLGAKDGRTVLTRAFSGRAARGLPNTFTERAEGLALPYPLQNQLTRPMRTAAAARGDASLLSLWAGQGVPRIRALPAAELVRALVQELAHAS